MTVTVLELRMIINGPINAKTTQRIVYRMDSRDCQSGAHLQKEKPLHIQFGSLTPPEIHKSHKKEILRINVNLCDLLALLLHT